MSNGELLLLSITPLDVLHLRGNRLFEGMGDGVALMPPWPSLFSGALRSRMLTDLGALDLYKGNGIGGASQRASSGEQDPRWKALREALGASFQDRAKGKFRVVFIGLVKDNELLMPAPCDIVIQATQPRGEAGGQRKESQGRGDGSLPEGGKRDHSKRILRLCPKELHADVVLSPPLKQQGPSPGESGASEEGQYSGNMPILLPLLLDTATRAKALSGWWMKSSGITKWQNNERLEPGDLVHAKELWSYDPRLGIALDDSRRTVREGLLYTSRAVALKPGVSFVVGVTGAQESIVPKSGLLRLGGDGRGAIVETFKPKGTMSWPWSFRPDGNRFCLWLVTPGIFKQGWLPTGCQKDGTFSVNKLKAKLVAACIPRFEVVSGWNMQEKKPKTALRVVPAGSVYYFEVIEGSVDDEWNALKDLVLRGLGAYDGEQEGIDKEQGMQSDRDIEGFSSFWLGKW